MLRYDAVLFDVDGTLIHSQPGILKTFAETFAELGVDTAGIDMMRYLGPPLRWSFGQHFDDPETVERAVEIYRRHYESDGMHGCSVYPGVAEMLGELRSAGVLLCTATSKTAATATAILREKGIAEYFTIFGGASLDKSVDTKTAVIRQDLADARLTGKRVLMVGDRQDDMRGAADCGIPAAAVLYGYGSPEELEPWKPVLLAGNCAEFTRYIVEKS